MRPTLAVTTAASDTGLLTLAELRAAVGVEGTGDDAALRVLGGRVADLIARACKVPSAGVTLPTLRLETVTDTFRLEVGRLQRLTLSRRPIVSVSSVTEAGTVLEATDYEIEAANGILLRLVSDLPAWWNCGKIVVAYQAGWATVPADLKAMAAKLAMILWSETARDPSLKRVRIDGVSEREYWVGPADDPLMPAEILQGLAPYMNYPT